MRLRSGLQAEGSLVTPASDPAPCSWRPCPPPCPGAQAGEQTLSGVGLDMAAEGKSVMSHRLPLKVLSSSDRPSVTASFQRWWASASVPCRGGEGTSSSGGSVLLASRTLSARSRAHGESLSTEALGKKRLSRASALGHLTGVPRAGQSPPPAQSMAGIEGSRCWLKAGFLFHSFSTSAASRASVSLHFLFSSFLVLMGLRHRNLV